jgi:hypothetical protein
MEKFEKILEIEKLKLIGIITSKECWGTPIILEEVKE